MLILPPSDASLVLRTLNGHPEAFEVLVLRNIRKAHAVARSAGLGGDAVEDAVQDAFLTAFRDLHSLKDAARFAPWLIAIVRNAARKQLIRRKETPFDSAAGEGVAAPAESLEGKDFREHLWGQVARLPGDVRDAVFLYYHEGESLRSVARSLEITVSGAKKRLRKGRGILRERLWRELEECLRDMLPSTREWKRRAGKLALLVAASLPTAWAARVRAEPLEPAGASGLTTGAARAPVSAGGPLILGGLLMTKKVSLVAATLLIILGALVTRLAVRRGAGDPEEIASSSAPSRIGTPAAASVEPAVKAPEARPAAPPLAVPGPGRITVVLSTEEGAPIEAAEVRSTGPAASTARSGPDGAAVLVGLPFGSYALDIAASGFGRERLEDVQVTPEREDARIEIALGIACSSHARVRDPAGRPVEDCELTVYHKASSPTDMSWRRAFHDSEHSDADGELRLDALPFGVYAAEAKKEGLQTEVRSLAPNVLFDDELTFDTGKSLEVLVLAHERKWIQGTITSGGQPVEGAKIYMDLKAEDAEMEETFFSGLDSPTWSWTAPGAYEIRNCAPGTYEVEVRAPGMAKLVTVLEVPGGSGVLRKDFELHPGGVVRGWLVREGRPSPGWVHVFRRTGPGGVEWEGSVRARPDGLFSFADALDDGDHLICGFADGHPAGRLEHQKRFKARALPGEVEVRVEGGTGPQEVVLESAHGDCAATGRVLDVAGQPIPGATLHIDLDASGLRTYGEKKTSEAGQFEIAGLPPGTLKLQVDARGFGTAHAEAVLGKPGEVARLDVVLEEARSLRARLEYADGEPDGDPRIALEMKTGEGWRHRIGGSPGAGIEGGVFTAERLPPGIYRISATFKEHAELLSPEIDLREVESAEVILRAEAGAAR